MSKELLIEIQKTIERITELTTIKRHYDGTSKALEQAYTDLRTMDIRLDKELKDVERLEGLSVKSVFYKVLGSQEEQIEKERQEYLQLSLKYKELKKSVELLEYEKKVLSGKVENLEEQQNHLESLKQQREQVLLESGSAKGILLRKVILAIDDLHRKISEIEEARKAGDASLTSLRVVIKHLKKAESWGNWDMTSRGRHYDHMKHSSIDRAIDEAYRTKHLLTIFKNELADVRYENQNFDLIIDTFNKFTDIFFDNLISDWMVQRKIKKVLSNVNLVGSKVQNLLKELDLDIQSLEKDIVNQFKRRDQILTS